LLLCFLGLPIVEMPFEDGKCTVGPCWKLDPEIVTLGGLRAVALLRSIGLAGEVFKFIRSDNHSRALSASCEAAPRVTTKRSYARPHHALV